MQEGQSGIGLPPKRRRNLFVILIFIFFDLNLLWGLSGSRPWPKPASHDLTQNIKSKHRRHQRPALSTADPHQNNEWNRQVHRQKPSGRELWHPGPVKAKRQIDDGCPHTEKNNSRHKQIVLG